MKWIISIIIVQAMVISQGYYQIELKKQIAMSRLFLTTYALSIAVKNALNEEQVRQYHLRKSSDRLLWESEQLSDFVSHSLHEISENLHIELFNLDKLSLNVQILETTKRRFSLNLIDSQYQQYVEIVWVKNGWSCSEQDSNSTFLPNWQFRFTYKPIKG